MTITYSRSLDIVAEPDVLVCGVGCAGLGAAIGAARMGVNVMAIEQFGFAGGFMTAVMSTASDGLTDMTTGEVVVGGVVLEILERLGIVELPLKSRKLFEPVTDQATLDRHPSKIPMRAGPIEGFKLHADRMLVESGVRVLYHTKLLDVVMSGEHLDYVVIGNKDGIAAVKPKVVIDCTGDADIAAWSGAPFEMAAVHQPGSLHFTVGNVQSAASINELYALTQKCGKVLEAAHEAGEIGVYAGPWIAPNGPGEVLFNAVRLTFDSTSARETTAAEIQGREDAWTMFDLWKERVSEFKDAHFVATGATVGARESRRIVGEATLTADDVLNTRPQPDSIAKGSWYLDLHPNDSSGFHEHVMVPAYDISYRTLLPQKVDNLLVAGRCHSATREALASSRVNMTAMAMGQAAGVAAAVAAKGSVGPREVDTDELRARLVEQGATLG